MGHSVAEVSNYIVRHTRGSANIGLNIKPGVEFIIVSLGLIYVNDLQFLIDIVFLLKISKQFE